VASRTKTWAAIDATWKYVKNECVPLWNWCIQFHAFFISFSDFSRGHDFSKSLPVRQSEAPNNEVKAKKRYCRQFYGRLEEEIA
jgi:hypothetical protein